MTSVTITIDMMLIITMNKTRYDHEDDENYPDELFLPA